MDDVRASGSSQTSGVDTTVVLLASGPGGSFRAFVGVDEAAYRAAFAAFVAAWGDSGVWFDPEARVIGSDGGVSLGRWRGRLAATDPAFALVVSIDGRPADVYLVDGSATAERIVIELEANGAEFALVPLEPLAQMPAGRSSVEADDLRTIQVLRGRGGRPTPPRARRAEEYCPRCLDQRLHVDPLFDASGPDGTRICAACGALDRLRRSA